ncbi:MAG: hypothetical protein ACYC9Q_12505 [Bacillota bacterium]
MNKRRVIVGILGAAVIGLGVLGLWQQAKANAQARAYRQAYQRANPVSTNGQTAYAFGNGAGPTGPAPGYGQGYGPGYGYGMMGGAGYGRGYGYGMMGGAGYGPAYGPGHGRMMGAYWGGNLPANAVMVDKDQAAKNAANYLAGLGNTAQDLAVTGAPAEYGRAWSFLVSEKSTGHVAFRLIVDKVSGFASREMGLAMHWDVKYGIGGLAWGTTANGATAPIQEMTVKADGALKAATDFLASQSGTRLTIQGSPNVFYGYYEFQTAGGGRPGPAVLVNGYTGQAAYSWLGAPK